MQHENDHLAGIMYTSLVEGELEDVEYEALEEADWEE
jgi:peptide deformylase